MPTRNERRKRAMTPEQYQEFKNKKANRHESNSVIKKLDKELASVQEQHKSELATMQAQFASENLKMEEQARADYLKYHNEMTKIAREQRLLSAPWRRSADPST